MQKTLIIGLIGTIASWLSAADSSPKDKLTNAAKQLGNKPNYSWTMTTKEADGSPGRLGPIDGKTEKDNVTFLSLTPGGIPVEVYMKGDKGAARALEGWQTFDEIAQTSGTAAAIVRFLRSYKAPAAQSADLAGNLKELKEADGAISGELKDDAIKELLLLAARRREGQEPPKVEDPKGSVKFWIKDGALTKYEINVQGKVSSGDRTSDINRTMTVEIKDVGSTKLEMPAEARQKLS
jgi:hypothetical protein